MGKDVDVGVFVDTIDSPSYDNAARTGIVNTSLGYTLPELVDGIVSGRSRLLPQ